MSTTPIELARDFVRSTVQQPSLEHKSLPIDIRNKVKHSETWLDNFQRVGDLLTYLRRFKVDKSDPTYLALNELGLKTFEDIVPLFEDQFSLWASDHTRDSDFVIGDQYNSYQILIYAGVYDIRSGGMFVRESGNVPRALIIKATLNGDDYKNEWLSEPNRLKYYLQEKRGVFGEHFKPNAAILNNPDIPIMTFVRKRQEKLFTYQGVFKFFAIHRESDGAKWFELQRARLAAGSTISSDFINRLFDGDTQAAIDAEREARLKRLQTAPKYPPKIQVVSTAYIRNPDVVAEVLFRAKGRCEKCHADAPFLKKKDNSPYLEVHHRRPLADGGEDTVQNARALCPNCHRESHYG